MAVAGEDVGVNTLSAVSLARDAITILIDYLTLFRIASRVHGDAFAIG